MGKAFIQESTLTDIADAIRAKNHTNNTYLPSQMATAINAIPLEEKDVNFYDYEGTLLYTYTKAEALALTELPALPDRTSENLTNEGWNWTLPEIKTQLQDVGGVVNVGCTYDTTDGNCYFFITVRPDDNKLGLKCKASVSNGATIYWGDGTSTIISTTINIKEHVYSVTEETNYVVKIQIDDGLVQCSSDLFNSLNFYNCYIEKAFISSKFSSTDSYTFRICYSIKFISISNTVWATLNNKDYLFSSNYNLRHLNVGRGVVTIKTYFVDECPLLKSICLPATITSIGNRFGNNTSFNSVTIPKGVTSIGSYFSYGIGGNMNILAIPDTVISISDRLLGSYNCIEEFTVPSSVTIINSYLLSNERNLRKLTFEGQVTSFASSVTVNTHYSLSAIYIKATTPPTVQRDSFSMRSDCKIYVPRASCAAYKAASNWADIADHIYPYDYDAIPDALYFYMPNGGDVTLTKTGSPTEVTLEYSTDCGVNWTTWTETNNVRTLTLAAGETMFIRNTSETSTNFSTSSSNYYGFSFSNVAYGGGSVGSLLCKNIAAATLSNYCFTSLFRYQLNLKRHPLLIGGNVPSGAYTTTLQGSGVTKAEAVEFGTTDSNALQWLYRDCVDLVDVSAIIMPSAVAFNACSRMFQNTAIEESPLLRAVNIEIDGYYCIMRDCANLRKVTTYMLTIDRNSIYYWLDSVAATGDLYCPSTLTIPTDSASGIPTGWTRHDID